jgi:hypothetical protein
MIGKSELDLSCSIFMEKIRDQINNLLAEWDPIGVPEYMKHAEYISYVDEIIENSETVDTLISYLEHLVHDTIGLEYDRNNKVHRLDVENLAKKIFILISK